MAKSSSTLKAPFLTSKAPDAAVISQICGWADEGEIERAGKEVETQLRAGCFSAEIFMIWLGFRFARDGLSGLPALLADLEAQAADRAASAGLTQKSWTSGLEWLAENLRVRLKFHAKFRDSRWQDWCAQLSPQLDAELGAALGRLREGEPRLALFAEGLELAYRKTFSALLDELGAMESTEEKSDAEAERVVLPELAAPELSSHEPPPLPPTPRPVSPPAAPELPSESAALDALRVKLAAFERLVAAQAWPVAAMVARDVEQELSAFDPVRYFPGIFAGYLRTLSEVGVELEQYMQPGESLESQALERLYRADPRHFLATLPPREASRA